MEPGIHSISFEQYLVAAGVSRSMLDVISTKTPAHFKARYIDKIVTEEDTDAMRKGILVHRAILEPGTMEGSFHVRPSGMIFTTTEGKAWKKEHSDKPIIYSEEQTQIEDMNAAVWQHPMAQRILKDSQFERSVFADDDGFLLKSRFDVLPKSGNVIADLKTCEDASLEAVEKSMWNYGYFRQAAFYLRVANLLHLDRTAFVFIFVEKTPPYCVACYQLVDEVHQAGEMMVSRDLQVLRNCYAQNQWPGYSPRVEACALPGYAMKMLEHT